MTHLIGDGHSRSFLFLLFFNAITIKHLNNLHSKIYSKIVQDLQKSRSVKKLELQLTISATS